MDGLCQHTRLYTMIRPCTKSCCADAFVTGLTHSSCILHLLHTRFIIFYLNFFDRSRYHMRVWAWVETLDYMLEIEWSNF